MNMGSAGIRKRQSQDSWDTIHTETTTIEEKEKKRRAEAESNRGPAAYQPNASPLGQTG